jgi:transcriptional regulator with AAA-type ATPase domain
VRELQNVVAQACLRAKADRIAGGEVSFGLVARRGAPDPDAALGLARGNQVHAARLLGVMRNVVRNRMAKHTIVGIGLRSRRAPAEKPSDETTGA